MGRFVYLLKKGWFLFFPKRQISHMDLLLANGNLKIGNNCDLRGLEVETFDSIPGKLNIEIGDDCHLMGKIILYSRDAKVKIGNRVFVGPNTQLIALEEIDIDNDILISWGCVIMDNDSHSLYSKERATDVVDWKKGFSYKNWSVVARKKIKIEKKVWIGFNSIILKGVYVQEGTVVASGSVVTKTFDPYSVIGGNPAKFIKKTE